MAFLKNSNNEHISKFDILDLVGIYPSHSIEFYYHLIHPVGHFQAVRRHFYRLYKAGYLIRTYHKAGFINDRLKLSKRGYDYCRFKNPFGSYFYGDKSEYKRRVERFKKKYKKLYKRIKKEKEKEY